MKVLKHLCRVQNKHGPFLIAREHQSKRNLSSHVNAFAETSSGLPYDERRLPHSKGWIGREVCGSKSPVVKSLRIGLAFFSSNYHIRNRGNG